MPERCNAANRGAENFVGQPHEPTNGKASPEPPIGCPLRSADPFRNELQVPCDHREAARWFAWRPQHRRAARCAERQLQGRSFTAAALAERRLLRSLMNIFATKGNAIKMGHPLSEMEPVPRRGAARVDLKRVVFAKSQQFDRPLMTLWRTVGVRVDCRLLMDEAPIPQGRGAARPHYGRIKAARCGPVGWLKKSGISAPCNEVHFSPQPAFLDSARRINARRTSRARAWSTSAVRARLSVVSRAFRPFVSTLVTWHIAAKACPHKSRQPVGLLRGSAGGPGCER